MDIALGSLEKPELPLGDCSLIGIQENLIYSNEGFNFILSLVEVGHWVAQTYIAIFYKLPEITDFGLLQQSQNRARFWIC